MATRKKKTDAVESDLPKNKLSNGWPQITQGTHLTVRTFEDGRTDLIWDDAQLLKEVREAIVSAELQNMKPAVRAKAATRRSKTKA